MYNGIFNFFFQFTNKITNHLMLGVEVDAMIHQLNEPTFGHNDMVLVL
jgi:hypothetical protein